VTQRDTLTHTTELLRQFVAEREWGQFHNPKNLALALASEAGELLSELRWISDTESDQILQSGTVRTRVQEEIADVAIALILLCDRAGIDLIAAIEAKIAANAVNYPVESSRGNPDRSRVDG
jgi:dCTP diphosphatase